MKKLIVYLFPLLFIGCDNTDDDPQAKPALSPDDFQLVAVELKIKDLSGQFRDERIDLFYEDDKIIKIVESEDRISQLTYDDNGRLVTETYCEENGCHDIWIYEYEADKLIKMTNKEEGETVNYVVYEYPSADTILVLNYYQGNGSPEVIKGVFKNENLIKIFELKDTEWIETDSYTYDLSLTYPSSFENFQHVYWEQPPFKNKNLITYGKGNFGNGKTEVNLSYTFDEHGNLVQIKDAAGEVYDFIYEQLE